MVTRTIRGIRDCSIIPELERDSYIWRFDFAGNLRVDTIHHTTEPLVRLHFTRLKDNWKPGRGSPYTATNVYRDNQRRKIRKELYCGVGLLQILPAGCVCLRGEWFYHEAPPKENIKRFKKVRISRDTARPANGVLPANKRTEYLLISHNQNGYDGLIIPMMEIIRFYYTRTTRFMAMLFTPEIGQLDRNIANIKESRHINDGRGTYRVQLRPKMLDIDAPVIARIVADKEIAHRAASMIRNDYILNRQKHGNDDIPPTAKIPFEGETNLTASGVSFISGSLRYFYVIRLLKCSHPFPWKRLEIGRDNDGRSDKTKDITKPEAYIGSRNDGNFSANGDNRPILSYDDNADINRRLYEICSREERYTDLVNKEIARPPKKPSKARAGENKPPSVGSEDIVTTGPATTQGTQVGNIEITTTEESNMEWQTSSLCREVIERIEREGNYHVKTVAINNRKGSNLSYFPTRRADNSLISWSFLDRKRKQRRKALLVELCSLYDGTYLYLLETERRKGKSEAYCLLIIYQDSFLPVENNAHKDFLAALAENKFSKYRKIASDMELNVIAVKHTSLGNKKYAERICKHLKNARMSKQ